MGHTFSALMENLIRYSADTGEIIRAADLKTAGRKDSRYIFALGDGFSVDAREWPGGGGAGGGAAGASTYLLLVLLLLLLALLLLALLFLVLLLRSFCPMQRLIHRPCNGAVSSSSRHVFADGALQVPTHVSRLKYRSFRADRKQDT